MWGYLSVTVSGSGCGAVGAVGEAGVGSLGAKGTFSFVIRDLAEDIPGGAELTAKQRKAIRQEAIERGLIPDVKMKPGTKYPDFEGTGLVERVEQLPEELWNATDRKLFEWLDSRIEGGRPEGTTWHHSEIDGRMELVPFGTHNIINHKVGRSLGNWSSHGKR